MSGQCALCRADRKLKRGHIVPRFVYRWAQSRPGMSGLPDGPTRPMLCGNCEDSFSFDESEFARLVFHPLTTRSFRGVKYGGWLRRFAASVCWRVLEERITTEALGPSAGRWATELASCRDTWRCYLTGKRPDVGGHHIHLLTWNAVLGGQDAGRDAVPQPLQRTIAMDVSWGDHDAFVCAKLGPVILIGLIANPAPKEWHGARINAEGKLKPREVIIPKDFRDYLQRVGEVMQ